MEKPVAWLVRRIATLVRLGDRERDMLLVAIAAGLIPAQRALGVDPLRSLPSSERRRGRTRAARHSPSVCSPDPLQSVQSHRKITTPRAHNA